MTADACTCSACQALAARYESDPGLLARYRRKLLIRGWAGRTHPTEKAYILAHADWARGAAERGRASLAAMREQSRTASAHLSNPLAEMAESGDVVLAVIQAETGTMGGATATLEGSVS